ncbi:prion-inhibition and propagation-domain-containing protein [Aspergillus granulosus]|uniref:Prion-inhibition and propagation-domain-containing protein n=1 Tax=Aspergillus granulosus TaxID=176169 RepID=A0ABR4GT14_9EURO
MATQGQLDAAQTQFSNIDQIMKGTEGLSNEFKDFRNDRSKTGNVRAALKNNLRLIQKVVNTVEVVGNAALSFASVSAHYDKIMAFFDFTHRFFDRLSMIEDKTPQQAPFQRCVAREYAKKKRFKKWFSSLIDGSDGALSGAIQEMEEAVNELTQAVGLATPRTVEILNEIVQSMNGNVEFLVAQVTVIDGRVEAFKSETGTLIEQTRALDLKQDAMLQKLDEQARLFNDAVFKTSLLKLDVVRLRLTRWGSSVGLANVGGGGDGKQLRMTNLAPGDQEQRLRRRNPTVGVLDPAGGLDGISASLHQKMEDLAKKRQGTSELEQDQVTILYEEKNFARFIEDIGELVGGLVDLFPGIQEEQRKLCEEEVSRLNMNAGALSLLKEVAAGQDKLLSETVVKIGNNSGRIGGVRFGGS